MEKPKCFASVNHVECGRELRQKAAKRRLDGEGWDVIHECDAGHEVCISYAFLNRLGNHSPMD
jgi:hypothetical protein